MAVRVVARIRPAQQIVIDRDLIVSTISSNDGSSLPNEVKIPNPRNDKEDFTFQFNSLYDQTSTQQELFDKEG